MSSSLNPDVPASLQPVPFWLSRLYNDDKFEELDNTPMIVKLMPLKVREVLWSFSRELIGASCSKGGVTSQACRVFERYCAALVLKYKDATLSEWEVKKLELKQRLMLLLGVSLILASKIESTQSYITGSTLQRALQRHGMDYTLAEINAAEWDVFIAIEYRLPLWTNVQKAHMFVSELGLSEHTLPAGFLMDMIDFRLPLVYERFRVLDDSPSSATSSSDPGPSESPHANDVHIRSIHLVAGVVLATVRLMRRPGADIASTLARWSRAPVCYIQWLGNIIFQFVMERMADKEGKRHLDAVDRSEDEPHDFEPKRHRAN